MNPITVHQIKHYLRFFAGIPARLWCVGHRTDTFGRHCALGHLDAQIGKTRSDGTPITREDVRVEGRTLRDLIAKVHPGMGIATLNDGSSPEVISKYGKHPRTRVLNFFEARLKMETNPLNDEPSS